MNAILILTGAVGIASSLAALVGLALVLARDGRWPMALACLAGIACIIFLTLLGLEYADEFWKGRS